MEHEDGLISAAKARKTVDDMWDTESKDFD